MSKLSEDVRQKVQEVLDELGAAEKNAKESYYELNNFLYALEYCRKKLLEIREAVLYRERMKDTPDLPGI